MRDLHMHSVYSDGKNTPEEMVAAALERGMSVAGLSEHSHAEHDPCSMPLEKRAAYRAEMERLRRLYAGRIEIRCGLERDYYADDQEDYDYIIGSVHALRMRDGQYVYIDWSPERLEEGTEKYFGGDWYAMAEEYFRLVGDVVRQTRCDLIGHFDLVSKFNEKARWFDPEHPRYRQAWQSAADALLKTGKTFEINTGAISRGYRTEPYPGREILQYLQSRGAKLMLSSDAHRKEDIGFQFERWAASFGLDL